MEKLKTIDTLRERERESYILLNKSFGGEF